MSVKSVGASHAETIATRQEIVSLLLILGLVNSMGFFCLLTKHQVLTRSGGRISNCISHLTDLAWQIPIRFCPREILSQGLVEIRNQYNLVQHCSQFNSIELHQMQTCSTFIRSVIKSGTSESCHPTYPRCQAWLAGFSADQS